MAKKLSVSVSPYSDLGRLLRTRRQETGLSVRAVAERTGLSPSTVSRIENGLFLPTLETGARLAHVIGVALSDLPGFGRKNDLPFDASVGQGKSQASSLREATSPAVIRLQDLLPGTRKNLRKVASRQPYRFLVVLRGRVEVRGRDGSWVLLAPGMKLDCNILRRDTFFAEAVEPTELLWVE